MNLSPLLLVFLVTTALPLTHDQTGSPPPSSSTSVESAPPTTGSVAPTTISKPGGDVRRPRVLQQVNPEYTEEARRAKISGEVVIALVVDPQGKPSDVHVTHGVGYGLDEKAVAAVKKYKFSPATKDGVPIAVPLSIAVTFRTF